MLYRYFLNVTKDILCCSGCNWVRVTKMLQTEYNWVRITKIKPNAGCGQPVDQIRIVNGLDGIDPKI